MTIKELEEKYPVLFEVVLDRRELGNIRYNYELSYELSEEVSSFLNTFMWDSTEEGHNFWYTVSNEEFEKASIWYPQYFSKTKNYTVRKNGLLLKNKKI